MSSKIIFDTNIDNTYLTDLEKACRNNNYELADNLILQGNTIYTNKRICNSYLKKKFSYEHDDKNCIPYFCYKNSVYFSFECSYNIIYNIYKTLINISLCLPDFFFDNTHNDNSHNNTHTEILLTDILDYFINYDSKCELENINYKYDINFKKYNETYSYIYTKLVNLLDILKSSYSKSINLSSQGESSNNYYINYNNEIICFHSQTRLLLINEKKNINEINDFIYKLNYLLNEYSINRKLIILILNQQEFELYNYELQNNNTQWIYENIDKIYDNDILNINYIDRFNNTNILVNTAKYGDYDLLVQKLINLGTQIRPTPTLIPDIINKGHINVAKVILDVMSTEILLTQINLFKTIINYEKMRTIDRLDLIKTLVKKRVINDENIFEEALRNILSYDILQILFSDSSNINLLKINHLNLAVRLKKTREFDLIANHFNLSNIESKEHPIFVFLNELPDTNESGLMILRTTLKYIHKINDLKLNNITPLWLACRERKTRAFDIILKEGGDPFYDNTYNADILNSLHLAILTDNIDIIKILFTNKNNTEHIYNTLTGKKIHPLVLALKSKHALDIINVLVKINDININYVDNEGISILSHIVDSDTINNNTKEELLKLLIKLNVNIVNTGDINQKPLIVKLVERNLFQIVVIVMNKLINLKEIDVGGNDIIDVINNDKDAKVIMKDKNKPNYYNIALVYIRQCLDNQKFKKYGISNIVLLIFILMILAIFKLPRKRYIVDSDDF